MHFKFKNRVHSSSKYDITILTPAKRRTHRKNKKAQTFVTASRDPVRSSLNLSCAHSILTPCPRPTAFLPTLLSLLITTPSYVVLPHHLVFPSLHTLAPATYASTFSHSVPFCPILNFSSQHIHSPIRYKLPFPTRTHVSNHPSNYTTFIN